MWKSLPVWAVVGTAAMFLGAGVSADQAGKGGETKERGGDAAVASIGQKAPEFALKDQNGREVKLSDLKGKVVVLEWLNDGCPFVRRHYEAGTFVRMNDKYAGKGVVHLAINSTAGSTAGENKKFAEAHGVKYPVLDDSDGKVGRAYGARSTPHLFVIDKDGRLAYKGAVDDDPDGDKPNPTNYVEKALDEILAAKPVTRPETKSYGCAVKYRD